MNADGPACASGARNGEICLLHPPHLIRAAREYERAVANWNATKRTTNDAAALDEAANALAAPAVALVDALLAEAKEGESFSDVLEAALAAYASGVQATGDCERCDVDVAELAMGELLGSSLRAERWS